jgi:predicted transcriptional regulator
MDFPGTEPGPQLKKLIINHLTYGILSRVQNYIILHAEINFKLSQCLIKHHVMKMYREAEVELHALLISVLDEGELLASYSGHISPRKSSLFPFSLDTVGLRAKSVEIR